MSKKESNPKPEGLTKPPPPPAPPEKSAIFELDHETFLMGMGRVSDACEEIMASKRSTIEAKTAALDLQLAALRMKGMIKLEGFWK